MIYVSSLRKILCVSYDNTLLRVDTGRVVDDNNCRHNRQMTDRNRDDRDTNKSEVENDRKWLSANNV